MATFDRVGRQIKRGDVYYMEPPHYDEKTCLIEKTRPYVVINVAQKFVVGLPITTGDKSRWPAYHVKVHDRKHNIDRYVICNMPISVPVEKVSDLTFVMPNHYMKQIDETFAKNMGIASMSLDFLHDPIINMVKDHLNTKQNSETISVIEQCINLLTNLNNNLKSPDYVEDEVEDDFEEAEESPNKETKQSNLTLNEVDTIISDSTLTKRRYKNFFDEDENTDYIKHYIRGDYDYIQNRYSDDISTMHTRAKYLRDKYDYIEKLFVESEKHKQKKSRKRLSKDQRIDYAKHYKAKDYDYIYKTYGHDREYSHKYMYSIKKAYNYIAEMF